MKTSLVSIMLIVLAAGSIGLAVHDDGGGGGGVYTPRTQDEMRQLLQDYQARRLAQRRAAAEQGAPLASTIQSTGMTEEQEMLQLQQLAREARRTLEQAKRASRSG